MYKVLFKSFIFLKLYFFIFCNSVFSNDFNNFKNSLIQEGLEYGISSKVLKENIYPIKNINTKVLKLYNNQPEFKITFRNYQKRNINTKRIEKGKRLLVKHKDIFNQIKTKYSVPAEIIVAIWALESNFGYFTGSFNIIEALTTLSFESRRKKFFKKELFNALKILDNNYIDSNLLKGSWAGAMGQSQFMPSSYLNYAVDFDSDGRLDIWNSNADVFASIANYLKAHGWKKNEPWSFAIKEFKENSITLNKKYTIKDLKSNILLEQDISYLPNDITAQVKRIESTNNVENFLVFKNFLVLKKYNNSDFYALTVGALANKIKLKK